MGRGGPKYAECGQDDVDEDVEDYGEALQVRYVVV